MHVIRETISRDGQVMFVVNKLPNDLDAHTQTRTHSRMPWQINCNNMKESDGAYYLLLSSNLLKGRKCTQNDIGSQCELSLEYFLT